MLKRPHLLNNVRSSLRRNPVTAILGPRQCGKTTLALELQTQISWSYFDLENPVDLSRLDNPLRALESLRGLVVIDEIQRRPDLFALLRVLADRNPLRARFLILGSASFELMRRASESLAGRIEFIEMEGFSLAETGTSSYLSLWLRGGFPKSFLARSNRASSAWRENFVRTFLERDIPQMNIRISALALRRFWAMAAHYHAQIWNGSEIGSSLGINHTTSRHYLDILTGAFVIRQLSPWYENLGKRTVKSPKVYVRDSGLLHHLLQINDRRQLESHPKLGASWEGFILEQILCQTGDRNAYFWSTHSGASLDLLLIKGGKRWGIEIKYADAPKLTKSMTIAFQDLKLQHLWVIYPGSASYSLSRGIECVSFRDLDQMMKRLGP